MLLFRRSQRQGNEDDIRDGVLWYCFLENWPVTWRRAAHWLREAPGANWTPEHSEVNSANGQAMKNRLGLVLMQLITWAQYSHSSNNLPTLPSCPLHCLTPFCPGMRATQIRSRCPSSPVNAQTTPQSSSKPPSLWSVGIAHPVTNPVKGCTEHPLLAASIPLCFYLQGPPNCLPAHNHPCSWECVFCFHPTHEKPSAGRSHGHSLCLFCQQRHWSVGQLKSCQCPEVVFSGWYYSCSAMNIYSSHAFSRHPTQLYQQLHSWWCQGQFLYCRVGHQNTPLNVPSVTGVTLWGIATNLLLRNGLPHLYWDLSWCSPGVHMLTLLCLCGKPAVPCVRQKVGSLIFNHLWVWFHQCFSRFLFMPCKIFQKAENLFSQVTLWRICQFVPPQVILIYSPPLSHPALPRAT